MVRKLADDSQNITYNRTGEPAQSNAYNGLDDRVSATSGSTTHAFVYDSDGRVMGEYGASAADVIAETIWLQPEVANDNTPFGGDDGAGGYAPLAPDFPRKAPLYPLSFRNHPALAPRLLGSSCRSSVVCVSSRARFRASRNASLRH